MRTQPQRNEIGRRILAVVAADLYTIQVCDDLQSEWNDICGMEDTTERTEAENDFEDHLLDMENTVAYRRARFKM